ncbi:Glucan endo-1,6-beta-glucosidase B [Ceratobasidium theobromae]|uniref:Glucan endo-1,6-beta-glucosidase B n=1 Tax=Ceratobasidium theobromae TaxID=1582974 RepID=A0A5N5QDY4_9AGAM|nr:Glucan endo-1,6-beta-glucosidase B [Ceratobasidium theobromae]
MKFHAVWSSSLLAATAVSAANSALPVDKVYGLGGWLLSEPWMFPNEWITMGGERCDDDCSRCAASEFGLVQKLGQKQADKAFESHWKTWFTKKDVDAIAAAGLNTVRVPVGWWINEGLVDRETEFFPRGGMRYLKRGLRMLKKKGIHAILDLHALPGVSTPNQMFAGRCTSDVQFYTEKNYNRALAWAATMTTLAHVDPDFSNVFSIEAINEPIMDSSKTPGYGEYQKNFVKVVRLTELALGIQCPDTDYSRIFPSSNFTSSLDAGLLKVAETAEPVLAAALRTTASSIQQLAPQMELTTTNLRRAVGIDAEIQAEVLPKVKEGHGAGRLTIRPDGKLIYKRSGDLSDGLDAIVPHGSSLERHIARRSHRRARGVSASLSKETNRKCLTTMFPNKAWQWGDNVANPADAANGPQAYDAHLYFSFGGVADPNAESYLRVICNTDRVRQATADNNRPLVFGEWSLATNFNASREFLHDWADAQRLIYAGQADGWIFWSFKIEAGSPNLPNWSYFASLDAGFFNKDPTKLNNPNVCDPWIQKA